LRRAKAPFCQPQAAATTTIHLDPTEVEAFKAGLRGELLLPTDPGYETARHVWNGMIDRRPGLIARCTGAADVLVAVTFAREHGVVVSIRGGGHNVSGRAVCDGGLMIDLSPMKSVRVDPARRTARAEAGVLWGEFDHETQAFGLATPGGSVATTGIAGLTLGGGQGWLNGKYGLTLDNLLSADVVTADGRLLTASQEENADLFWALRGAGANFGVVTSFEYRRHPVGPVLGGMILHPIARVREALRFYREFAAGQPDELTTWVGCLTTPDGVPVVAFVTCFTGPLDEGERAIAPLRGFGQPLADTTGPLPYTAMQAIIGAGFPPGRQGYWKSGLTASISDEAIDLIAEYAQRVPSPHSAVVIVDCHGAYAREGRGETAYPHRDLQFDLVILSSWVDPAETSRNIGWTREFFDAVQPHLSRGVYVNDLGEEGGERARDAYGENFARLVALKKTYDPTNFFHLNQNIPPGE
jgi:hypothetical protein